MERVEAVHGCARHVHILIRGRGSAVLRSHFETTSADVRRASGLQQLGWQGWPVAARARRGSAHAARPGRTSRRSARHHDVLRAGWRSAGCSEARRARRRAARPPARCFPNTVVVKAAIHGGWRRCPEDGGCCQRYFSAGGKCRWMTPMHNRVWYSRDGGMFELERSSTRGKF